MRILFFSSIFPRPYRPNLGIYCFHLCNALAAGGHDVRVVSPRSWLERPRPLDEARPDPLPGLRDLRVDYPGYFYTPGVLRTAYGAFMWASVGRQLKRAIADFRPDSVVSYWAHPDGQTAVRAAGEAGVPSAVMVGGSDVLLLARKAGGRRAKIMSVLRAADAVIAVSNHMRDQLVEYGTPAEKVHVVYRGVDGKLFSPGDKAAARARLGVPAEGKVLVAIGNLVPVKGLDVLLNAVGQLRGRGVQFRLYLVGEGASRGALEAQAASLGLTDVVTFVGAVAQRHLPDWYRAADLTVLSSHSEGIPNVLRESMACGTPFVATRVGGIHEIADDPANRLVSPADPAALADAIARSLASPSALLPNAAHASTWADSAQRVVDVMRPLISSVRRGAAATLPATALAPEPELEGAKPS